jgi:hypothetical protein
VLACVPIDRRYETFFTCVLAGVVNSTACNVCRAGTFWTGSGWQSMRHDDHGICLESDLSVVELGDVLQMWIMHSLTC